MDIKKAQKDIKHFLKINQMDHESIDFDTEVDKFIYHMNEGLRGESDLKMLPAYIDISNEINYGQPVIAVDCGGTNLRRALITIYEDEIKIEEYKVIPMPGTRGEINKDEFIAKLIDVISPILNLSPVISFCFSYPMEIMPNRDGKVLGLTKELQIKDIEGIILGETLVSALQKRGYKDKKVILLNDTVAVLLSVRKREGVIGLILGTGVNASYIEENQRIFKDIFLKSTEGTSIINIQSGGYRSIGRGKIDIEMDKELFNTGFEIYEKMVSGAYLGKLITYCIQFASRESCLSKDFFNILKAEEFSTKDVSEFLSNPADINKLIKVLKYPCQEDRIKIYFIIDEIIERAAKIVAIKIKAIIKKTHIGNSPLNKAALIIDGSTFYGLEIFRKKFDHYIYDYLEKEGYYIQREKIEQATLIGTAVNGLIS